MYDPDRMDSEFPLGREARDRNDEVLERSYSDRRFKTAPVREAFPQGKRLEKLFEL